MAITATCPGCSAIFRLPEELAGKSVRCQKCAGMFVVPMLTVGAGAAMAMASTEPEVATETAPENMPLVEESQPVQLEPMQASVEPVAEPTASDAAEPAAIVAKAEAKPIEPERPPNRLWTAAAAAFFAFAFFATGAFASIWIATHLAPTTSMVLVPPLKEIVLMPPPKAVPENRFKRPDDRVKFPPNPVNKMGAGQAILPGQASNPQRLIRYLVNWGADGLYEETHELNDHDPLDPAQLGRGPYKEYIVTLTKGQNYRIEVASQRFPPMVSLYDRQILLAHSKGAAAASIDFNPNQTATYRIRAIATHPFDRGQYSIKIRESR